MHPSITEEHLKSVASTMHELSIAESIIELSLEKAREQNACSIQKVKVRLGEFTTIAREALEFAFEVARKGTLAANAQLEIEIVPMVTRCVSCGPVKDFAREVRLICTRCGLPLEVVAGAELQLEYVDLE
jgi:hydrogenase nickel incorporation protein HypA/HybF